MFIHSHSIVSSCGVPKPQFEGLILVFHVCTKVALVHPRSDSFFAHLRWVSRPGHLTLGRCTSTMSTLQSPRRGRCNESLDTGSGNCCSRSNPKCCGRLLWASLVFSQCRTLLLPFGTTDHFEGWWAKHKLFHSWLWIWTVLSQWWTAKTPSLWLGCEQRVCMGAIAPAREQCGEVRVCRCVSHHWRCDESRDLASDASTSGQTRLRVDAIEIYRVEERSGRLRASPWAYSSSLDWHHPVGSFAVASKVIIFGNGGRIGRTGWKCPDSRLHRHELWVGYLSERWCV